MSTRNSRSQTLGGPSTTIVFRRSIGVAFHSGERFCVGFFSAGAGVDVGFGRAAVFVSIVEPGVTRIVAAFSDDAFELLTGMAGVGTAVPGLMIRGVGGITTAAASAGPATSGISSADTVDLETSGAPITTVGDGIDRTSEAAPSDGTTMMAAFTGNG